MSYTFDVLNRATTADYPGTTEDVTYAYDQGANGVGRLTGIQDAIGSAAYVYNPRGTLASETRVISGQTYVTQYSYDVTDRLTGITYPSGRTVSYTRNTAGHVSQVSTTVGGITTVLAQNLSHLPFGPAENWLLGNGIAVTRSYDQDYRLTQLTDTGILNRTLAYDTRNNITGIADNLDASRSQSFGYDALSRLTSGTGHYGTLGWTYDGVGNEIRNKGSESFIVCDPHHGDPADEVFNPETDCK